MQSLELSKKKALAELVNSGFSEDEAKDAENEVQIITDTYIALTDKYLETKEKEIMVV